MVGKLLSQIQSIEIPPYEQAVVTAETEPDFERLDPFHALPPGHDTHILDWGGCPICIRLCGTGTKLVVINVEFLPSIQSHSAESERVIVVPRQVLGEVVGLLDQLAQRESQPRLRTFQGVSRDVQPLSWDDLVLDDDVVSLLRNDFTNFFQREDWFRQNRLPYRRGYLLHGKAGNGKSSAIRAMMTSQNIDAYTLRFFDHQTDDDVLERMFDRACHRRPSMIVLEDLDRSFPRTGGTRCKVSMGALLNCLDGVATSDGMVVVATANQPTLLDPAILRRPGRFDRVVPFLDPTPEMRTAYFNKMLNGSFTPEEIESAVVLSSSFSFAQCREAFVIAGQKSFERGSEITATDLVEGVLSLRRSTRLAASPADKVGFDSHGADGASQ